MDPSHLDVVSVHSCTPPKLEALHSLCRMGQSWDGNGDFNAFRCATEAFGDRHIAFELEEFSGYFESS